MRRCFHCMSEIENSMICPHCGFDYRQVQNIPYALPPGSVLQGKYLIGNVLGQGGFGITYLGFDMILEVKVAIKEYFVSGNASRIGSQNQQVRWMSDPGNMNHFITEARRMAKLDNMPEIAHVRDIFYANQTAYIIMEYVEGISLNRHLEKHGIMAYDQAVKLMLPVIEALGRVHEKGIVHRDISPDNLMMEPEGKLRVLDLGAAGDLSLNNAQATQMVARYGFSPYEQYLGAEKIGPYTDVYAVCATIYYCCTGKMLPDAMHRIEQYVRTKRSDLELSSILPPAAVKVLQKGLALESKDRIPTMAVLAELLKKTVEEKPVVPAKSSIDQAVKGKVKKFEKRIDQLKKELETEWEEENTQEQPERISLRPRQSQMKSPQKEPQKKEAGLKQKPSSTAKTSMNETSASASGISHQLIQFKKPLMAGAAALAMVVCIAAFSGKEKKPKEQELIITETTSENTEVVNIQDIPERTMAESTPDLLKGTDPTELETYSIEEQVPYDGDDGNPEVNSPHETTATVIQPGFKTTAVDGGLAITGYVGTIPADLVLPDIIDGKLVTKIDADAFRDQIGLRNVTIPDGVTSIGTFAFCGCTNLSSITIPDSVISIEHAAFAKCESLTSVVLPDKLTKIAETTFSVCTSLANVTISDNVTNIGKGAFYGCSSLENIIIPNSVIRIEEDAFSDCINLKIHSLPNSITKIDRGAFSGCKSLIEFEIPDSIAKIGNYLFAGCTGLKSVIIPDSVTSIGYSAFYGCSSLENITIPDSVTSIERSAFESCVALQTISIPDGVVEIVPETFYDCSGLMDITIPKTVQTIYTAAFLGCDNLKSVTLPMGCKFAEGPVSIIIPNIPLDSKEAIFPDSCEVNYD